MECDGCESDLVPSITVQSDWEDFIDVPHKQIWVSCKFRNQPSIHGKIRGGTFQSDTQVFSATVERNSLCVKYNPSGHLCRFLPAYKLFSKVHSKAVLSIDASDRGLGVSSCAEGKLIVWDSATGEVRRKLEGHLSDVYKCKLFPSGIVVLSAGADMHLKIWSAETGQCPVSLSGHTQPVTDLAIIDRGRNVVSVSKDGTARLWNCGSAECVDIVLKTTQRLNCCSIGKLPAGMQTQASGNEKEVGTEDKLLLVGSEEGDVYGVVLSTRTIQFVIHDSSAVNAVIYFSHSRFIVGLEDGRIIVFSPENGNKLRTIYETNSPVHCLALVCDKGVLAGRHDGTVCCYPIISESQDRIQLTGSDFEPVYDIVVTTKAIFTSCRDGQIRKYQFEDMIADV